MLPISRPTGTATITASPKPAKMRPSVGSRACSRAPPSMLFAQEAAITLIRGIDTRSIRLVAAADSHARSRIATDRKPGQRRVIAASRSGRRRAGLLLHEDAGEQLLAQRGEARLGAGRDLVARKGHGGAPPPPRARAAP